MDNACLECEICREISFKPSRTPCCKTKACRLCALTYVLKNRTCWDCGGKTIHTDILPHHALRDRIENLFPRSPSQPLHCDLCGFVVQKGVRTSCCSSQACRSCARKFVLINKVCWGEGCPPVVEGEVWISILETDTHLRSAAQMYKSRGSMDQGVYDELDKRFTETKSSRGNPSPSRVSATTPTTSCSRVPPTPHSTANSSVNETGFTSASSNTSINRSFTSTVNDAANRSTHQTTSQSNLSDSSKSRDGTDSERNRHRRDDGDDAVTQKGVDSHLRDMTISPDVMEIDDEDEDDEENSQSQDEVSVINGDDESRDGSVKYQRRRQGSGDKRRREDSSDRRRREREHSSDRRRRRRDDSSDRRRREGSSGRQSETNDSSQDGSEASSANGGVGKSGGKGDWVFVNGEGWTLKPSKQKKTRSSWIKDANGWSVKVVHKDEDESNGSSKDDAGPRSEQQQQPPTRPSSKASSDSVEATEEKSGKRNMEPANSKTVSRKRLKKDNSSNKVTEPKKVCKTMERLMLYTDTDNYIPLMLNSVPPSEVKFVRIKASHQLKDLLRSHGYNPPSQRCRVIRRQHDAFVVVNIQIKGSKGERSAVHLPKNFAVGEYSVVNDDDDSKTEIEVVDLTMDLCVDYSIGQISIGHEPVAVKCYLKFQGKAESSVLKRDVLNHLFVVSKFVKSNIKILTHIVRPDPCQYLAPQTVVSNDMTLDLIVMKQYAGTSVSLSGKEYLGEVRTCEHSQALPTIFEAFNCYPSQVFDVSSDNSSDKSGDSDLEIVENDDIAEIQEIQEVKQDKDNKEEVKEVKEVKEGRPEEASEEKTEKTEEPSNKSWVDSLDEETRLTMSEDKKDEGNILFSKACYSLSCRKYSDAILLNPKSAVLYANRSACYTALKNGPKGLEDAEMAIALDLNYVKGFYRAGKAALLLGELDKAKAFFATVTQLDEEEGIEEEVNLLKSLEKLVAEFCDAADRKDFSSALDIVKDLIHQCPNSEDFKIKKAEVLAKMGTFEESNRIINDIKGFNSNAECLYVKALCLYSKDNAELAIHFLNEVFKISPEHAKSKVIQERLDKLKEMKEAAAKASNEEKYDEALDIYNKALEIDTDNKYMNSKLHQLRGSVLALQGNHLDAIEEFHNAVNLDRLNTKAYYCRARSSIDLELYDDALSDAEQTIRLESGNNIYRSFYSEVKAKFDKSNNVDYYLLLKVDKSATQDEIRKAYRRLAMSHHPDRHSTAEEKIKVFHEKRFKAIGEAYGVLSDEPRRLLYDKGLLNKTVQQPQPANYASSMNMANAMRNAALWATLAQQQQQANNMRRHGMPTGAGGSGAGGLAGASPFLFVPGNPGAQQQFSQQRFGQSGIGGMGMNSMGGMRGMNMNGMGNMANLSNLQQQFQRYNQFQQFQGSPFRKY